MADAYSEFERLRRLVPERPDFHLHNWGIWCRGDHVTDGYDDKSSGLSCGGVSGVDAFAVFAEPIADWAASVSNTIIEGMHVAHSTVLQHVYAASVFRFRRNVDDLLVEAAAEYWRLARKKDLT